MALLEDGKAMMPILGIRTDQNKSRPMNAETDDVPVSWAA